MKKRELLSLTLFIALILIIIMDSSLVLPNQVLIAADLGIYFDTIGLSLELISFLMGFLLFALGI